MLFTLSALTTVFLVVDPAAVIPLFSAMTARDSVAHKSRTAGRAAVATLVILGLFAVCGNALLGLLGISLAAFRVAGGVLLFFLAADMLRAQPSRQRTTPEEVQEGADREDISIFPLAIPMLAGPGAISTVMVLMARASSMPQKAIVLVSIGVVSAATRVLLGAAEPIERRLGKTGLNVLHRVMGLILAATAMQFVLDGLREAWH